MSFDLRANPEAPRPSGAPLLKRCGARRLAAVLAAAAVVAGCAGPDTAIAPRTATRPSADLVTGLLADGLLPGVLSCAVPSGMTTRSDTETIGSAGGRLVVGRTSVTIPAGAVSSPQTFTLTVPASREVGIEIRAAGYDHFVFDAPVTVTIDFARCGDLGQGSLGSLLGGLLGGSSGASLHGWFVDSETGAPLEDMGGTTNPATRTHTFRTDHFSNYLLAE
jgi:hypothetical protein